MIFHVRCEPGPRGGVGEGFILMYMRIGATSTRPEAQGLGGLVDLIQKNMFSSKAARSKMGRFDLTKNMFSSGAAIIGQKWIDLT